MDKCQWCPPDGQCYLCERAEWWETHTPASAVAAGIFATFDAMIAEQLSPGRITELGALFGTDRPSPPPTLAGGVGDRA